MTRLISSTKMPVELSLAGYAPNGAGPQDGTASVGDLWRIVWRHRLMIVLTAGVLFAATLVYCLLAEPLYTASSALFIDPRDRQVFNDTAASTMAPDGGITQVESQARLVESSTVLLHAIAATHLADDPEFNGTASGPLDHLMALFGHVDRAGPPTPEVALDRTIGALWKRLAVKRADRVFVIEINVSAHTAEKAAKLANAIADGYLADQAESRTRAIEQAVAGMSGRLEAQRAQVEADENAIEQYKRSHGIVAAGGHLLDDQNLVDLNAQLTAAQSRTTSLKAKLDQIRQAHGNVDATGDALQSQVISKLREQEGTLVQHLADLEARMGARHPAVTAARSQLAHVRQLIGAELARIAASTQADYQRALSDQQMLAAQAAKARTTTEGVDQASVRLRELQRDLEADRSVYASFLTRSQQMREQAGIDTTNARVITRALPPESKSWPPSIILLAGAIGSGLGLGSGAALVREYVRPTVLSAAQIERVIGVPVIAVLPGGLGRRSRRGGAEDRRWFRFGRRRRRGDRTKLLAMAGLALRRLYNIGASEREPATVRSLVLTSQEPDMAARQAVCDLFANAARLRGERVLLVHADSEDSMAEAGPTLAEVLRGEGPAGSSAAAAGTLQATLATASVPSVVQDEAGWNGARHLLAEARRHFDLLVIDGGVLEDNLAIAPLLVATDEVILVGQLGRTSLTDATNAADAAAILGRSITAVVLVDPAASV